MRSQCLLLMKVSHKHQDWMLSDISSMTTKSLSSSSSITFIFFRANSNDRIEMGPGRLSWYSWQFVHHFFAGLIFRSFQIDSRKRGILWQRSVHSFQDIWGFHFTFNSDNISGNQALSASPAGIVFHILLIIDTSCAGGCGQCAS